MHALLKSDQVLHPSWRHPAGTPRCFDSSYAARLIEEFNATGELAPLQELLVHCEELLRSQFEYRATTKYVPLAELMGTARVKIWRSLRLFDPARGVRFLSLAESPAFGSGLERGIGSNPFLGKLQ
jgi:hypothetical protein